MKKITHEFSDSFPIQIKNLNEFYKDAFDITISKIQKSLTIDPKFNHLGYVPQKLSINKILVFYQKIIGGVGSVFINPDWYPKVNEGFEEIIKKQLARPDENYYFGHRDILNHNPDLACSDFIPSINTMNLKEFLLTCCLYRYSGWGRFEGEAEFVTYFIALINAGGKEFRLRANLSEDNRLILSGDPKGVITYSKFGMREVQILGY